MDEVEAAMEAYEVELCVWRDALHLRKPTAVSQRYVDEAKQAIRDLFAGRVVIDDGMVERAAEAIYSERVKSLASNDTNRLRRWQDVVDDADDLFVTWCRSWARAALEAALGDAGAGERGAK